MPLSHPKPINFSAHQLSLMTLLTELRASRGDSALIWIDLPADQASPDLVQQLISSTRGYLVGANAGYFVEQMTTHSIAAVFEYSDNTLPFARLTEQLEIKLGRNIRLKSGDAIQLRLWLNAPTTGTVGELVHMALQESDGAAAAHTQASVGRAA